MVILFTGHRDKTCQVVYLDKIAKKYPNAVWMHGGAIGFDSQVDAFAKEHGLETFIIRPDYETHWKKAPLIRNDEMLRRCNAVVALWDGRTTGGTYYTVSKAQSMEIPVYIIH